MRPFVFMLSNYFICKLLLAYTILQDEWFKEQIRHDTPNQLEVSPFYYIFVPDLFV